MIVSCEVFIDGGNIDELDRSILDNNRFSHVAEGPRV